MVTCLALDFAGSAVKHALVDDQGISLPGYVDPSTGTAFASVGTADAALLPRY